jgi:hypothetical protein
MLFSIILAFFLGVSTAAYFILKYDDEDDNEENWTEEDYEFMKNYRIEEEQERDEEK